MAAETIRPESGGGPGRRARSLLALVMLLAVMTTGVASARADAAARRHPLTASALLRASYRAARAQHSFELAYELGFPALYWVIQTPTGSQAVERFTMTIAGRRSTTYSLMSARRLCIWSAPGQAPPGAPTPASTPSCSAFDASSYAAEVFPFLSLRRPHLVGRSRVEGVAVTGVGGDLTVVTRTAGSTGSLSFGPVTAWIATRTRLPVAIGARHRGRTYIIMVYRDWNSRAVRFPPGTPN